MATETSCVCDVCHVRHIRSTVREYCPQCDQNLCGDCSEHHRIAKASKTHETITFEQYKTSPSFVQNINHRCDKHEYPLEFHCQSHNSLACKRCIVMEHKKCDDVVLLDDVSSGFNSSTALEKLEKSLLDVKSVITTAISKSKDNLKMLPTNEDDVVEKIKDMRKNINDHFDKLEQDLILKASQSKVKAKRCISRVMRDLETENKQVNEIFKNIEVLKECASSRQSFIGTRNLEQSLQQLRIQLQSMYEKGDFHDVKICCEFEDSLVNKEAIKSIGCVLPRKVNVGFTLKTIADKAGQTMDIFKIDGVMVEQLERIRVYGTEITACMMMKENITLFLNRELDRHSKVLKFISGNFEGDINLFPASVFDIAYLDEKRVLVTTGDSS
ncbi:E3 ubiquitin/ISG15 ligase TRIM25-like [Mytilus trossulus]|uniref:E3 ubiquitin/ISG15 ligase TRIM25-like n=1 Tax=Mytilus trossulus TaxID=6551 RepID=UPI0030055D73